MTASRFDGIYDQVAQRFPEIKVVTMDAGYKTPWICKRIIEDGRIPSMPYKRPMTKEGNHEWWKYVYDEYYDCVICPEYSILNYSTTNRGGYREYKSDPNVCKSCPDAPPLHHKQTVPKTGSHFTYGEISSSRQKRFGTRHWERRLTKSEKKRLSGSSPMPKKNTQCVIHHIEA